MILITKLLEPHSFGLSTLTQSFVPGPERRDFTKFQRRYLIINAGYESVVVCLESNLFFCGPCCDVM